MMPELINANADLDQETGRLAPPMPGAAADAPAAPSLMAAQAPRHAAGSSSLGRPLAGTLSRRHFERRLSHDLDLVRRGGERLAVLVVHLHPTEATPAAVLDQATILHRVGGLLRPGDSMAVLAADELAIIQMPVADSHAAHRLAARLLNRLTRHLAPAGGRAPLGVCLGLALYPTDGNRADLLIERAREAAVRARHWGGDGFCFHSRELASEVAAGLAIDHEMRHAVQRGEICLTYEPSLDLRQGSMAAAKASLMWRHPSHGPLAAAALQPIAERAGLCHALGHWALQQIGAEVARWHAKGLLASIRLKPFANQLDQPDFAGRFRQALAELDLPAAAVDLALDPGLDLDVTSHRLRANLEQLAALGVTLTLTGFGERPIDLPPLLELPIARLELPTDMVALIGRSDMAETALRALIDLGLNLGKELHAEGVETDAQLKFLAAAGCAAATGPLIGPALAARDFGRTLEQRALLTAAGGKRLAGSLH